MDHRRDHLTRAEIGKDAIQATAEAAATTVGEVVTIVTGAIKDVAGAVGGFATEVFEIRDASRRAAAEHADPAGRPSPATEVLDGLPGEDTAGRS